MLAFIQTIKFVHWGLLHLMFLDSLLADLSDNPIVFSSISNKVWKKEVFQSAMTNTDGLNHTESGWIYFFHTVCGNKNKICHRHREKPSSTQCQKAYLKIFIVVK